MMKLAFSHSFPTEAAVKGFSVIQPPQDPGFFTSDQLQRILGEVDACICMADTPFGKAEFAAAPKLRMLGNLGSGYNNVDVEEATKRGIPVFNTPTAVVNPTAEMTMSLLLGLCRGVVRYDRTLRTDGVCPKELLSYADMTLAGKTLGIVGYGRIGQKVAELAKAFGMRILICDSHHQESLPLEELLPQVDVLTLHLPYRVENHHLINAHTLSLMKSSAYLLNVARGPIVEEKALVEALKTGRLKGAALDVHEFEPLVSQAIRELPNVVITPHISTNLAEVRSAMLAELLEGMRFFQETHTLPANTVNKRELSY
jgi:phosphoglycerate dehydrogenase-like enzyme